MAVYHLANLELYVLVVRFAVAPIVVQLFFSRARSGSETYAAFLAVFLAANSVLIPVVAAFNTTEHALGRLHDRYLFYLAPLWLIMLFLWLAEGAPRPLFAALTGAGVAIVLPLLLPFSEYAAEDGVQRFNGAASGLWAAVNAGVAGTPGISGRSVLMAATVVLLAAAFGLPRRLTWLVPVAIFAAFTLTAQVNWVLAARAADDRGASVASWERGWLDESVPAGDVVTLLYVDGGCRRLAVARDSMYLSEFYNRVSTRGAHVGLPASGLPSEPFAVSSNGRLLDRSGAPLVADFVVTQQGVRLVGRRLREATAARLVLWEIDDAVRVSNLTSTRDLQRAACGAARP